MTPNVGRGFEASRLERILFTVCPDKTVEDPIPLVAVLNFVKELFGSPPKKRGPDMAWISQWAAASEEVGLDDTAEEFNFTISLRAGASYEAIVAYILDAARGTPVFDAVAAHLTKQFGLTPHDATRAIDRCMGGLFRAMKARPELCPNVENDPIAWHSFQMATADPALINDIEAAIE